MFVVDVEGGEPVTNHPRILEQEEAREHAGEAEEEDELVDGLLHVPVGLSDVSVEEAGPMRVLTRTDGRRIGTLSVADALTPVSDAQASLLYTFALVGALALALAGGGAAITLELPGYRPTTGGAGISP